MKIEVFTTVNVQILISYVMALDSVVGAYRRFGGTIS
jgi:hypothetical protein